MSDTQRTIVYQLLGLAAYLLIGRAIAQYFGLVAHVNRFM